MDELYKVACLVKQAAESTPSPAVNTIVTPVIPSNPKQYSRLDAAKRMALGGTLLGSLGGLIAGGPRMALKAGLTAGLGLGTTGFLLGNGAHNSKGVAIRTALPIATIAGLGAGGVAGATSVYRNIAPVLRRGILQGVAKGALHGNVLSKMMSRTMANAGKVALKPALMGTAAGVALGGAVPAVIGGTTNYVGNEMLKAYHSIHNPTNKNL